jgi:creatinine amidohydrolase
MRNRCVLAVLAIVLLASVASAQTNPLWREEKVKNYLPHMTSPEVRDLLTRTDMVLIPVPSIEQHAFHAPMGNDFYSGIETAKLIAHRRPGGACSDGGAGGISHGISRHHHAVV